MPCLSKMYICLVLAFPSVFAQSILWTILHRRAGLGLSGGRGVLGPAHIGLGSISSSFSNF